MNLAQAVGEGIRAYMMPDDQSRAELSQSSRSAAGARGSVPGRDRAVRYQR